jgi:epsilon-lactone hydrolase
MASEQARAVHAALRAARGSAATGTVSRADQLAGAEHVGDTTSEPDGVRYTDVDAGGVPSLWAVPDGADPGQVLLYFHGGGYCYCSVRSHRKVTGHLARAAGCRVLSVGYRLAPEHPYPAAVEDALTAYRWLARQAKPHEMAVGGDSAGGGLAVALLLRLRDASEPLPGTGVLLSPWVDLALSGDSMHTRAGVDVRQEVAGTKACADGYLDGHDPRDRYASPLYADLAGLPPLYIQAGDWDILVDDARRLADRAQLGGVAVRLDIFPEMLHAHQLWAGNMPEADDAITRIGCYLRALRPGAA